MKFVLWFFYIFEIIAIPNNFERCIHFGTSEDYKFNYNLYCNHYE